MNLVVITIRAPVYTTGEQAVSTHTFLKKEGNK
jgi:hypothetical protein